MKRLLAILTGALFTSSHAQDYPSIPTPPKPGDKLIAEYFALQTQQLTDGCLAEIKTAEDWQDARGKYREQLFEMLGIPSRRQRTGLEARVTGSQDHDGVVVENVVFQSLPGLYVTANFYRPADDPEKPLPAILYVCGHSRQKAGGISFGNKTAYHHHGMWFAKHGYVCLTIDTIQLGEIEGLHHGTYREGRWWWNARGYSPAGVEAWNGIRALDYLQSRAEADGERIGMTGRSGGGAYTWWVSALDERVKVAVPVAGIASLKNHVVDGTVEGHCDCMFHVNTYRWDFPAIAALVAPRPLLIANTDKDRIFPLDGVVDVYNKTRRIYRLLGAENHIGLAIAEGPHKDTQPLRTEAFHWFERHLKGARADGRDRYGGTEGARSHHDARVGRDPGRRDRDEDRWVVRRDRTGTGCSRRPGRVGEDARRLDERSAREMFPRLAGRSRAVGGETGFEEKDGWGHTVAFRVRQPGAVPLAVGGGGAGW